MSSKKFWLTFCLFIYFFLSSPVANAQLGKSAINGSILDTTGAAIAGATVVVTNQTTGQVSEVSTDENGVFNVQNLVPAIYSIKIEAEGFSKSLVKDLEVNVGDIVTINPKLTPAAADSEVIEVKASDVRGVDTTTSRVAGFVTDSTISNLPLNGRNFLDLAFLLPGNAPSPIFDPAKTNSSQVSSLGQTGRGGNIAVDGADNNDDIAGGSLQNFPQDSIQEFQIQTSRFGAEIGRSGSSVINIITKNGSNELHGNLGFFFRNDSLSGLPATLDRGVVDTLGKPPFDREQYIASIGGPIKRDRAWFFSAFEYRKQDGIILTGRRDQSRQQIINEYATAPLNNTLLTNRIDVQVSPKDRIFFRYGFEDLEQVDRSLIQQPIGDANQRQILQTNTNSFVFDYVRTFSANAINSFSFQGNKYNQKVDGFVNTPDLTFPSIEEGLNPIGLPDQVASQSRFQFRDNLTVIAGAHSLKFGGEVFYTRLKEDFSIFNQGQVFLATDFGPGDLNGDGSVNDNDIPILFTLKARPSNNKIKDNNTFLSFYIQDDVKVTKNFTLNLGLRYEIDTNIRNLDAFDQINPILKPFVGDKRERDKNNFAPRIGFNWDIFSNGRTSIHGGYGIYYERVISAINDLEKRFNGRNLVIDLRTGSEIDPNTGGFVPGTPTLANPFSGFVLPVGPIGLFILDRNLQNPEIQQFNFGIKQEIFKDYVISVDAIHLFGTKLIVPRIIDGIFNPDIQQAQTVSNIEGSGKSWYDGLLINVEKRASKGFSFLASYSLSKTLNYSADDLFPPNFPPLDPNNLKIEKANSVTDQRQRFTFAGSIDLPHGFQVSPIFTLASDLPIDILVIPGMGSQTRLPFAQRYAGGRQFRNGRDLNAFIASINSGGGAVIGTDAMNNPIFGPVPFVNDNLRFGDSFTSFDMRVTKRIKLSERINVQAIAEVFNLFNITNTRGSSVPTFSGFRNVLNRDSQDPNDPGFLKSSSFGTPAQIAGGVFGSGGPRAFQFAVKLNF
ncbi:MAG: hypothetical protein FD167_5 [bacterium]|nr:MAG: hypothetical protein FD167_5 [bacterium]